MTLPNALAAAAIYLGIPIFSLWISGRQVTWQGRVLFYLLWPILWLFEGPEELP